MLSLCVASIFLYSILFEYWLASLAFMLIKICEQIKAAQYRESSSEDSALHWSASITLPELVKSSYLCQRVVPCFLGRSPIQNPITHNLHQFPCWSLSYCNLLCNSTLQCSRYDVYMSFKGYELCTVAMLFACFTNMIFNKLRKIWLL